MVAVTIFVLVGGVCTSWGINSNRIGHSERDVARLFAAQEARLVFHAELNARVERSLAILERMEKDITEIKSNQMELIKRVGE